MKYVLLTLFLGGCSALPQHCYIAHTASVVIADSTGKVLIEKPSETVTFCPPSVEIQK